MIYRKQEILDSYPELELTSKGDFKVKNDLVAKYKIIDFHLHIFESSCGIMPRFLRKPKNTNCSFFENSSYPGGIKNFEFNNVGYKRWPQNMASISGIQTIWYNIGLPAINVARNATYTRLLNDMLELNIDKSVILPVNTPDFNSTEEVLSLNTDPEKTVIFGSLHPYETDIEKKIDHFVSKGIKGFKINPHIMNVNIDDDKMIALLKKISKTGLPIISCSGYQIPFNIKNVPRKIQTQLLTQKVDKFKKALDVIKDSKFIFAHGGLEENEKLISLMNQYPNTYTDISTQNITNIKMMISELGSNRLVFGSDYPYLSPAFTILSTLKATDSEKERNEIFSGNAKHLLNIS